MSYIGVPWTLLDNTYLAGSRNSQSSWERFFSSLGVVHFIAIERKDVCLSKSELVSAPNKTKKKRQHLSLNTCLLIILWLFCVYCAHGLLDIVSTIVWLVLPNFHECFYKVWEHVNT